MKKYRWIIITVLCVSVGLILLGWLNNPKHVFAPVKDFESPGGAPPDSAGNQGGEAYEPNQLVGLFENEEQAKECAELYGIELQSFSYGVAVFKVEGDPNMLIEKGKDNGWPELSLNHKITAF